MIHRGVAYSINDSDAVAVVLTKDSWNSRMIGVGAVPIRPRDGGTSPVALPLDDDPEQCLDPARLLVIPRERFGKAVRVLDDESLHRLERALGELIDAPRLMAEPLRGTRPPAGQIDYPQWGEIYYRNTERIQGEAKRYLVVSNDLWNRQKATVLVARTTTQPKHPTDEFPLVQNGEAQVVCGELAAVRAYALDLERRPQGQPRVGRKEMAAVVRGITRTHLLQNYLDPFEIEAASLEQ
jgi:mRNA-degrading endonuclease toxin of MazEF toxin-antitoxin module